MPDIFTTVCFLRFARYFLLDERSIYTGIFATLYHLYHQSALIKYQFCFEGTARDHGSYLSPLPQVAVVYFFQAGIFFHTSKIPNAPSHLKYLIPNAEDTKTAIPTKLYTNQNIN